MEKQFHTYRSPIISFDATESLLGIIKPGRYSGFDLYTLNNQSGANIIVNMDHSTSSIRKSLKEVPPVLGPYTGVIVTPQGQIIHNDDTNLVINIPKNNQSSDRYDLIYCEHQYVLSKGSNPAIYNLQQGVAGAGVPTLSNPEKRVLVCTVKVNANTSVFSGLTFTPAPSPELGGLNHADIINTLLGDYTSTYIIGDNNTVIENLSALDQALQAQITDAANIRLTKLDDWGTPDDNTDLNATTSRHGLLPKLSGNVGHVLKGDGSWGPLGGWVWKNRPMGVDFSLSAGTIDLSPSQLSGELDISTPLTPINASEVLLNIYMVVNATNGTASSGSIVFEGENGRNGFNCGMIAPASIISRQRLNWQIAIPLDPNNPIKKVYMRAVTIEGNKEEWLNNPNGLSETIVTVVAYR